MNAHGEKDVGGKVKVEKGVRDGHGESPPLSTRKKRDGQFIGTRYSAVPL